MGKAGLNVLGLGAVAVVAVLIAKGMLKPTQEKVERSAEVLSGAYEARIVECRVLEDSELPEDVPAPPVGSATFYLGLTVLYPDHAAVPTGEHALVEINGELETRVLPVDVETTVDEDGATVFLTFRSDGTFRYASLARDEEILVRRVALNE